MKQIKAKEPIRLRAKKLSNGNQSLYLDFYTDGKREYEFLKLYVVQERSKEDKDKNAQTLKLANAIKAKKIVELQNNEHGFKTNSVKSKANFITYIDSFVEGLPKDTKGYNGYICTMQGLKYHLTKYKGENFTFKDVDRKFLLGFSEYLKTAKVSTRAVKEGGRTLAQCTQWNYFNKFSLLLSKAKREGVIANNPISELETGDRPQRAEPRRTYLILDEVKKLASTNFRRDDIKRAFLFSCLCGLRISDVRSLKWCNIQQDSKENVRLELIQQKTGGLLYLPISPEAMKQLPEKSDNSELIFGRLPDNSYIDKLLKIWAKDAGITKNLTFHVARHTFATLGLTYGAELYTVSKLLGHSDIKITQIYADVINEKRRDAVNAIPSITE
ncbi:MAG: site-specific integrase [Bacteroides sp.]|uniref:site-specific integrase n=2 Tax=Bacteroides sp. TaxID=29523 RepID=UPI002FC85449